MLDLIRKGKIVQSVTSITLVNNTAKTVNVTVPSGKRWLLLSLKMGQPDNVQRTLTVDKYKEAAKTNFMGPLVTVGLGVGILQLWPTNDAVHTIRNIACNPAEIMHDGNTLAITWAAGGASAGGTDADGLVYEYLEIDE